MVERPDYTAKKLPSEQIDALLREVSKLRGTDIDQDTWRWYMETRSAMVLYPRLNSCLRQTTEFSQLESLCNCELGWKDFVISLLHNQEPTFQKLVFASLLESGYPVPVAYKLHPGAPDFCVCKTALEFLREHSAKAPLIIHNLLVDPHLPLGEVLPKILRVPPCSLPDDRFYGSEYMDLYIPFNKRGRRLNFDEPAIVVKLQHENMSAGIRFLKEELNQQYSGIVVLIKEGDYPLEELVSTYRNEGINSMIFCVAGHGSERKTGPALKVDFVPENSSQLQRIEEYREVMDRLPLMMLTRKSPAADIPQSETLQVVTKLNTHFDSIRASIAALRTVDVLSHKEQEATFDSLLACLASLVAVLKTDSSLLVLPSFYFRYGPLRENSPNLLSTLSDVISWVAQIGRKLNKPVPHYDDTISKLFYVGGSPLLLWGGLELPMHKMMLWDVFTRVAVEYLKGHRVGVITVAGEYGEGEKARTVNALFGTHFSDCAGADREIYANFACEEETHRMFLVLNVDCSFDRADDIGTLAFCALMSDLVITYHPSEPCRDVQECYKKIADLIEVERPRVGLYHVPQLAMLARGDDPRCALNQMVALKKNLSCLNDFFNMDDSLQLTLPLEATSCFGRGEFVADTSRIRKLYLDAASSQAQELMARFPCWIFVWERFARHRPEFGKDKDPLPPKLAMDVEGRPTVVIIPEKTIVKPEGSDSIFSATNTSQDGEVNSNLSQKLSMECGGQKPQTNPVKGMSKTIAIPESVPLPNTGPIKVHQATADVSPCNVSTPSSSNDSRKVATPRRNEPHQSPNYTAKCATDRGCFAEVIKAEQKLEKMSDPHKHLPAKPGAGTVVRGQHPRNYPASTTAQDIGKKAAGGLVPEERSPLHQLKPSPPKASDGMRFLPQTEEIKAHHGLSKPSAQGEKWPSLTAGPGFTGRHVVRPPPPYNKSQSPKSHPADPAKRGSETKSGAAKRGPIV
ncbi:MAG: hypothetical protein P4M11_03310 [Candidatus Pacebacteria bacterium]|nr:hypothetical protein [Candidatus Paceibacterota bacterium]